MEEWRSIKEFAGFAEVSSEGRVRSLDRYTRTRGEGDALRLWKGRILVLTTARNGYLLVNLRGGGKLKTQSVHSLVLEAFLGERPEGQVSRHKDGCRSNNVVANLEYGTPRQNNGDMWRHGTVMYGDSHIGRRLTEERVRIIRNTPGVGCTAFAKMYGVDRSTIWLARTGRTWIYLDKSIEHKLIKEYADTLI